MALTIRPLSYALGAEVIGVDLSKPVDDDQFAPDPPGVPGHGILLFRDQKITREQHIDFSRRFGELDTHDTLPRDRHPEYPELLLVTNVPKPNGKPSDSKYTGQLWHSDMSFTLVPALGSLLRGIEIPPVGGDTMFANMTKAYDALSDGMKRMIADLHGVHIGQRKIVDLTRRPGRGDEAADPADCPAGGARASGDRQEGALHRREGFALRRHDGGGEQAADRVSLPARDAAALRLPPPVARQRHRAVGQPLHDARRAWGL